MADSLSISQHIAVHRNTSPRPKPAFDGSLGFGQYFSDHMFRADYDSKAGWTDARIQPYGSLHLDPTAAVFHYGQSMFEGSKAFRQRDGSLRLFRPEMHAARMNAGAPRLCMPMLDDGLFVAACKALVRADEAWVPGAEGTSLYLRPTMVASEGFLGVRPANRYVFFIVASPVASYYGKGLKPVRIWVETEFTRAPKGGLGATKAGANYVASLAAAARARKEGFDQVLWMDSQSHTLIEEVGTMNLFAVIGDTVITPPLSDSILAGVTRDSVLTLLKASGRKVEERPLSFKELVAAHHAKTLREVFGTGTAAVISPVGELTTSTQKLLINEGQSGPLSLELYSAVTGIQSGTAPDVHRWMVDVD
jgi:branched-chain amino acid aminotransferase